MKSEAENHYLVLLLIKNVKSKELENIGRR